MAQPELIQTVQTLSRKVDTLLGDLKKAQEIAKKLEIANTELRKQHEKDVLALESAKRDIEFLKISHRLAATPEALVSARNQITQLIKTIDSCIRMINDD
ncbi:MAG: hypothetical protein J1D77_01030 [Muribaculaceae bacterium]|nr:hypothetical protein [Muribaculaceae bacterium]